jgi:methylmalonyl-CoA mutase
VQKADVLKIDNQSVLASQKARLADIKAKRDNAAVTAALEGVTEAAKDEGKNLLGAAIVAAKARATLGEITDAMEAVFGRHTATNRVVQGVYSDSYSQGGNHDDLKAVTDLVQQFEQKNGRRPRILVAKMGQDGHDRGAKVISTGFADLGFDVDIGPLFRTPGEVAKHAVESDVHVVGVSSQAAGHRTLIPQLIKHLKAEGADNIVVIAVGVIPAEDYDDLYKAGVALIFGPGSPVPMCARKTVEHLLQQ